MHITMHHHTCSCSLCGHQDPAILLLCTATRPHLLLPSNSLTGWRRLHCCQSSTHACNLFVHMHMHTSGPNNLATLHSHAPSPCSAVQLPQRVAACTSPWGKCWYMCVQMHMHMRIMPIHNTTWPHLFVPSNSRIEWQHAHHHATHTRNACMHIHCRTR
jgi:hypothetical protein